MISSHTGEYLDLLERQMSELQKEIDAYSSAEQSEFEKSSALRKKRLIHEMEMADREQEVKDKGQLEEERQKERLEKKRRKVKCESLFLESK